MSCGRCPEGLAAHTTCRECRLCFPEQDVTYPTDDSGRYRCLRSLRTKSDLLENRLPEPSHSVVGMRGSSRGWLVIRAGWPLRVATLPKQTSPLARALDRSWARWSRKVFSDFISELKQMSASNQSGSALTIPTGAESQKHARNVMAQTKDRCTDAFEDVVTREIRREMAAALGIPRAAATTHSYSPDRSYLKYCM